MNHIYKMLVKEISLPKKLNWSKVDEDDFEEDDFTEKTCELYFPTFESLSEKLDELTDGYHQYSGEALDDAFGIYIEILEYHNDTDSWDKELHIETSCVYLTDSFLEAVKEAQRLALEDKH